MGHAIQGFVGPEAILRAGTSHLRAARVVPLAHGFALLPALDDLYDEVGGGGPGPWPELWKLSPGLAALGAALSAGAPVAYLETDHFGGAGSQAAVAWEGGAVVLPPAKARRGPVDAALRRAGAPEGGAGPFVALGLDRLRHVDGTEEEEDGG